MGENFKAPSVSVSSLSTLTIPPKDSFFGGGNMPYFSPGPMTLVSTFFSESEYPSFSQLLAGAMASPLAKPPIFPGEEENCKQGYKQNRPMNLMVAQSPFFTIPTAFTPSGLLNSPGFLSAVQVINSSCSFSKRFFNYYSTSLSEKNIWMFFLKNLSMGLSFLVYGCVATTLS